MVTLTLASPTAAGDTVTVSYTGGAGKTQDIAGNTGATLVSHAVTNIAGLDLPASAATAATLVVDGAAGNGTIDAALDVDWWRVNLTAGVAYRINLDVAGINDLDPYLSVRDSNGSAFGYPYNDDAYDATYGYSLNSEGSFTPSASGTYFVIARDNFLTGTGAYSLSVDTVVSTVDTIAATTATTASMAANGPVAEGTIETAGDRDWWRVTLTAGTTYEFDLDGLYDPYLRLLGNTGTEIRNSGFIYGRYDLRFPSRRPPRLRGFRSLFALVRQQRQPTRVGLADRSERLDHLHTGGDRNLLRVRRR
jgi:hypothetical protein